MFVRCMVSMLVSSFGCFILRLCFIVFVRHLSAAAQLCFPLFGCLAVYDWFVFLDVCFVCGCGFLLLPFAFMLIVVYGLLWDVCCYVCAL